MMLKIFLWILEVGTVVAALHVPLWLFARKRGQFVPLDVLVPFIAILSWLSFVERCHYDLAWGDRHSTTAIPDAAIA